MLTIFSISPESFTEKIRINRNNAINSWRRIQPACEIILFGGDKDAAAFARANRIRHIQGVALTSYGTPLLSDVFAQAQSIAAGKTLMFSNCDMMYFDDLIGAIAAVPFSRYMLCGRRWDIDVAAEIPFDDQVAWEGLRGQYRRKGRMHGSSGLDFFIFPRTLRVDMPPMVVGRPGWDSWFMWHLRSRGIAVIDGTGAITALHQNHDHAHLKFGAAQYKGPEMQINYQLAGGYMNMLGLREADWIFLNGKVVRPRWPRRIFSLLGLAWPYRLALAVKRQIHYRLASLITLLSRSLEIRL